MTTKPKSVLAWAAVSRSGYPLFDSIGSKAFAGGFADYASDSAEFRVHRVRITVVRERKREATKRRAKR
jgi:hypothetical protein